MEGALKAAAGISMGTEISSDDLDNIQALCDQVGPARGPAPLVPPVPAPWSRQYRPPGPRHCG